MVEPVPQAGLRGSSGLDCRSQAHSDDRPCSVMIAGTPD